MHVQAQTDEPISKVLERYACTVGRNQVVQGHGATVLINPATLQVRVHKVDVQVHKRSGSLTAISLVAETSCSNVSCQ